MSDLKRALLEGTQYLEPVALEKPNGEILEVEVRPLNSLEASEVESLSVGGLKGPLDSQGTGFTLKVDVDVSNFQNQQWKGDVRAVRYGLSHGENTWTDEEVVKLHHGWLTELATVICRISGIKRVEVSSFRVSDGPGDGGPGGDDGNGDAGPVAVGDSGEGDSR